MLLLYDVMGHSLETTEINAMAARIIGEYGEMSGSSRVEAGHEPPFVILDEGKAASLLNTQLVIGIDPDFPYREHGVPFGGGDIFCIFSDGVIEAKNKDGKYFGRKGVKRILEENAERSPREIIEAVLDGTQEFLGEKTFEDEVSIVVVKSKGE